MKGFWKGRRSRAAGLAAGLLSMGLVAAACGGGAGGQGGQAAGGGGGKSEPINIGYITWAEDVATTYLWQRILEKRGYQVELKQLQVAALFSGMARGQLDLFLDTWLPVTHKQYWQQYGDQLKKYAQWYDGATLELAVPKYAPINSIAQLDEYAKELNGKITGIGPGAGETDLIKNKIMPAYNLKDDLRYVTSGSAAMLAALKSATSNREPIVVALWHPHWAYAAFPIRDLQDPKNAWPGGEKLYVTGRQDFGKDYPKVAKWLSNYKLNDKQLSSLENKIFSVRNGKVVSKAENPQQRRRIIDEWISNHRKLVNSWVGGSGS